MFSFIFSNSSSQSPSTTTSGNEGVSSFISNNNNYNSTGTILAATAAVAASCYIASKTILPSLLTSPTLISAASAAIENGQVPDWFLRIGIRHLIQQRIDSLPGLDAAPEVAQKFIQDYVDKIRNAPIAIETKAANEQHYELPPEYFELVLGPRKKYSCCLYEKDNYSLGDAENAAFRQVCERAMLSVEDQFEVLDLGCGWGSLTLYLLEHFPKLRVTSVSNSAPQGKHIRAAAQAKGGDAWTSRLTVHTQDANNLDLPANFFDRILSIEMLEHMKNYGNLFARIGKCVKPGGYFFAHIFTHRKYPYDFVTEEEGKTSSCQKSEDDKGFSGEWMARTFFSGGTMPSPDLFHYFCQKGDFHLVAQWAVDGKHYAKTSEDWLKNQDAHNDQVEKILYDSAVANCKTEEEKKALPSGRAMAVRFRMFYLAVAENWNYNDGKEWFVSHYRFQKL